MDIRDALLITSHNIHGYIIDDQNNKLKSNIIIGIDDTNGNTEDIRNNINERFPEFTKSYRKVLLNSIHQKYSFEDQKIIALPLHHFFVFHLNKIIRDTKFIFTDILYLKMIILIFKQYLTSMIYTQVILNYILCIHQIKKTRLLQIQNVVIT